MSTSYEMQEISTLRQKIYKLEAKLEFLYRHLGVTFVEETDTSDDPRIIDALRKNNVLEAIKYYREVTGAGLAEAKAAVEDIRARRGL